MNNVKHKKYETPEEYERIYILKLEDVNIQLMDWLKSNDLKSNGTSSREYMPTSQEVMSIINGLQEYERYFKTYEPLAQYLNKLGLSKMSQRVAEILEYINKEKQSYRKTYIIAKQFENYRLPFLPFPGY